MSDRTPTTTYYAIIDPHDPAKITAWRRNRRGQLDPWPRRTRVGPWFDVTRADVPDVPADRHAFIRALHDRQAAYLRDVTDRIDADPPAAMARWSTYRTRCCFCGRALTDETSRAYGIGPDCGADAPPELLAALAAAVSRLMADEPIDPAGNGCPP